MVKTYKRVLAARVILSSNDGNSVHLEMVTATQSNEFLQPGTEVMYLLPINEIVDDVVQSIVDGHQRVSAH